MSEWSPEVCRSCLSGRDAVRRHRAEIARLARMMARSEKAAGKYKPTLLREKERLAEANRIHEGHIATCEGLSEAPHGSLSRYTNAHCRCEECRDASRLYHKSRQESA